MNRTDNQFAERLMEREHVNVGESVSVGGAVVQLDVELEDADPAHVKPARRC